MARYLSRSRQALREGSFSVTCRADWGAGVRAWLPASVLPSSMRGVSFFGCFVRLLCDFVFVLIFRAPPCPPVTLFRCVWVAVRGHAPRLRVLSSGSDVSADRPASTALAGLWWKPGHLKAYLPGSETDRDQEGGVSTARPIHCTPGGLTRTTTPNRGGSRAQFLLVGTSVRAVPFIETKEKSWNKPTLLPEALALLCSGQARLLSCLCFGACVCDFWCWESWASGEGPLCCEFVSQYGRRSNRCRASGGRSWVARPATCNRGASPR